MLKIVKTEIFPLQMPIYGNSYNKRNLEYYRKFYTLFPNAEIVNTRVHNLEWSHIRRVLSVSNPEARLWYLENASSNMWSVRELDRNISTQYFERRLAAQLPRTTIRLKTKVCCPLTTEVSRLIAQSSRLFKKVQQQTVLVQWQFLYYFARLISLLN